MNDPTPEQINRELAEKVIVWEKIGELNELV